MTSLRSIWITCLLTWASTGAVTYGVEPGSVDLGKHVLPILSQKCHQCHGGIHKRGGLDLRTLASILEGGKSGAVVVPGKADESKLWKLVSDDTMPKTNLKLSSQEKAIVRAWIDGGAKPAALTAAKTLAVGSRREPLAVARDIDREIDAKRSAAKVPASPRSDDAEFLRRVTLDIIGRVPTLEEVRAFLSSSDPDKRRKLIDELLSRPEYGQHFATTWVNVFAVYSVNANELPIDPLETWMAEQLNKDRTWSDIVRDMLSVDTTSLTKGNPVYPDKNPEGSYFYFVANNNSKVDPAVATSGTAQLLLGIGLQCAECHDHPTQPWKQTDFWGMAAFFGAFEYPNRIGHMPLVDSPAMLDKAGKPQPVLTISNPEARNHKTRVPAQFPDGKVPTFKPDTKRRALFADWLTAADNPFFARTYVNRMWGHFFGRGFVDSYSDIHDANPPSHPKLFEMLTADFVAGRFDPKHLIRSICNSETYQRSGRVSKDNRLDETHYSHMRGKVLSPEMLYDSLRTVLEAESIELPEGTVKIVKGPKQPTPPDRRKHFVKFFRGMSGTEDPTEYSTGITHVLRLMNQADFNLGGKLVDRVASAAPALAVEELFLAAYARRPSGEELQGALALVAARQSPVDGYRRVLWALLNSSEFRLNH